MPRNPTTGVFTRVSNSFSNPVFGTVIDPTDANDLFDDYDLGITDTPDAPVSSTDNALARFDGATGKFLQNSVVTLDDTGNVSGATIDTASSNAIKINGNTLAASAGTATVTVPNSTDTLVGKNTIDTLTNKTIDTAGPNTIKINGNTLAASAGTATVTIPNSTDTLVGRATSDNLTNKSYNGYTLTNPGAGPTTIAMANGSTFATSGAFSVTLTSTGSTNVTLPTTGTLSTRAGSETLTNKTIDTAGPNTIKINGNTLSATAGTATVTVPNSTDTLVGRATSDTLSNKIIDTANTNALKVNGNAFIASAGTASVTVPNSSTTLVGRDTVDTLTNKTMGLTEFTGALQTSGSPPLTVNESWFGAGVQAKVWVDSVFATTDTTKPSLGTHLTLDHAVGASNPYSIFGMADFRAVVGRSTGGNIYGLNIVMDADTGFNKLSQGIEVDANNYSGTDAGAVGASSAQYALTVAGSGPNKITAPIFMTGAGNGGAYLSKYGIAFDNKAVSDYAIYNTSSSSPNSLFVSSGAHQYGLNWHGASFSTAWATVPNNVPLQALNAAGNTLLNILKLTNTDRIDIGDVSHATNIAGTLQIGGNTFGYTPPTAWTPALTGTSGGPPTYGIRVGYYLRVGPLVIAFFFFTTSSLNGLSGVLSIGGLPVASANNANDVGILAFGGFDGVNSGAGQTHLGGLIQPNTTAISLTSSSATGAAAVSVTGAMVSAASTMYGVAIYHT